MKETDRQTDSAVSMKIYSTIVLVVLIIEYNRSKSR